MMKIKFVIVFILAIALIASASASQSCYVRLDINETKLVDNSIQFSLLSQENLWGDYGNAVPGFENTSDYFLNIYDNTNVTNQYSLYSSRFLFYDNFNGSSNPGGVNELDSGVIDAVIAFNNITKVSVVNNGTETDLNVNSSAIQCIKTCKDENETGVYGSDVCCGGLTQAENDTNTFACVRCGDGTCNIPKTLSSCFSDCSGTCGDGKLDGNEVGIDCGYDCSVGCKAICFNNHFDTGVEEGVDCGGYCGNSCTYDFLSSIKMASSYVNGYAQLSDAQNFISQWEEL